MEDYKEMSYFALKAECRKQNLDTKGKKNELLERLGVTDIVKEPEAPAKEIEAAPPVKEAPALVMASQEELNQYLPQATHIPKVDTTRYAEWLTNERLEMLNGKIAPIAAGKGKFKFDIDHENAAFQVEFSGKGPILESTTLIDTDNNIVTRARQYYNSRLVMGGDNQKSRVM